MWGRDDEEEGHAHPPRRVSIEEPMECPFKEAGCETKLVRRVFDDHMSTQTQQHLLLTFQKMTALSTNYDTLSESHDTLNMKYLALQKRCNELEQRVRQQKGLTAYSHRHH